MIRNIFPLIKQIISTSFLLSNSDRIPLLHPDQNDRRLHHTQSFRLQFRYSYPGPPSRGRYYSFQMRRRMSGRIFCIFRLSKGKHQSDGCLPHPGENKTSERCQLLPSVTVRKSPHPDKRRLYGSYTGIHATKQM